MVTGQKIRNIRELKNFTQGYMADKLQMSQSGYSKIEKESNISDEKLQQIAEALEVKPEDIMAFDSQKYFNNVGNVEGDNSNSYNESIVIGMTTEETELIKKLYEDKISLLEKLLSKSEIDIQRLEKIIQKFESKYGEL